MDILNGIIHFFQKMWQNSVNSIKNGGYAAGSPAVFYAPPPVPILPYNEFLTPAEKGEYPTQPYSSLNRPSVSRPSVLSRLVGKNPLLPYPVDTMPYPEQAHENTQLTHYTASRIANPATRTHVKSPYTFESVAHMHKRGYGFPFPKPYLHRMQQRSFLRHGLKHAPGHGPVR